MDHANSRYFEKRTNALLARLARVGPFVAASLVSVRRRCGHPGCHCATGPGHPSWRLTWKDRRQKTRTVHVPADLVDVTGIAAGPENSLAVKSDGTVVAWGQNHYGQSTVPSGLSGVIAVEGGFDYSLALKSDGTVVAWGHKDYGQSTVPEGLSSVTEIAAGMWHSLALKSDGTVVAWGSNDYGQSTVPDGLNGVIAIAAGTQHSLALRSDGTVVAWGDNSSGQSTVPSGLSGVIAIAAGGGHSLALVANQEPPPAMPHMQITRSDETLALSWPGTAVGFRVQTAETLSSATAWNPLSTVPVLTGERYIVNVPLEQVQWFFRLVKP